MINFTMRTNTKQLDDMIKYMERADREIDAIGRYAMSEITDELLDDLTDEPPPRNYPADYPQGQLEWTSEKQRRAFWASDGFGAGIPFKRSGGIKRGWKIIGKRSGNGFIIFVSNNAKGAQFVGGTLSPDLARAVQPMQKFHKITGHTPFSPKVQFWLAVAQKIIADEWQRRFAKSAGVTFTGKAYTKPTKRSVR